MEKSKLTSTEKGKPGEEHSNEHAHHFLLYIKNSSWEVKESIPHTTMTFHGKCMNNVPRLCQPNFGDKRTCHCIMTIHHLTRVAEFLLGLLLNHEGS
jgi:hypothetical protein